MKKTVWMLLMVIAALTLALAGCGTKDNSSSGSTPSEDGGDGKKVYKVGTEATFAPFESVNDTGKIVGIDVDILNAIADEMDFEVEWKNIGWEPVFQTIKNGETDIGASGITITDERKESFDFTDPYYESQLLIVVKEDSKIKSLDELKDKKVSVQINATGHMAAKKLQGEASTNIMAFESQPIAIQEMLNGNVDAAIGDNAVVYEYIKAHPDQKIKIIQDDAFEKEYYGFMVQKGNKELLDKLNEGLKKIKENGKLKEITGSDFE
ncbi:basic amino acid ABC transporter substrate-binding protein [Lysinibacillus sp. ZYM-1]|uniref:basic amino acid ABC transporter substrate-binding protein n=1 Tax=Lysinibacillus sp. ZYM-1 TaxID=1681184 RepID=UPI0006CE8F61|nr:basic amino acid ABC transporter substrate-binding protein [Lysinibacillus sp. ZYM-1]KPN97872.1 amino acid ABC transporter substrate-binding protein [Lysinibacillus sp. ZYM-1]